MEPFAFDYKKTPELKKQFTEEYEKNLEKYNAYLEEEKAYQKALEPVKEWIEADDKAKNGDNPDYEENKEARLSERLASNEKANLDYDKELKDYREKMENLFAVRESYVKKVRSISGTLRQKKSMIPMRLLRLRRLLRSGCLISQALISILTTNS